MGLGIIYESLRKVKLKNCVKLIRIDCGKVLLIVVLLLLLLLYLIVF